MKVIIELDDDMLKEIRESHFEVSRKIVRSFQATIAGSIRNGEFVPNNATNGDMIKAMFPNGKEYDNDGDVRYEIEIDFDYSYCSYFDGVWWNTPYKRGSEKE